MRDTTNVRGSHTIPVPQNGKDGYLAPTTYSRYVYRPPNNPASDDRAVNLYKALSGLSIAAQNMTYSLSGVARRESTISKWSRGLIGLMRSPGTDIGTAIVQRKRCGIETRHCGLNTFGQLVDLNETYKIALAIADDDAGDGFQILLTARQRCHDWKLRSGQARRSEEGLGEKALPGEEASICTISNVPGHQAFDRKYLQRCDSR